jgi:hypothetical protein
MDPRSAAVAFLAVAALLVGSAFVAEEYRTATNTVETTGTIQHAEIETYQRVRPSLTGQTQYDANVSYTYTVEGERFRSSAVFLGTYSSTGSGERTATVATDYADGQSVTVHYLPESPDRSYLIPRYSFLPGYALVVFGLLLGGEYLTPGTWLTGRVARFLANAANGRRSDRDDEPHTYDWEDGAVGEHDGPDEDDTAEAPVTGVLAVAVWGLVALACLGAVGHYLFVSAGPHSGLSTAAAVVGVGFPMARVATTRPWET